MSSSLRSQPPGASGMAFGPRQEFPNDVLWTEIKYGDWAIQVCEDKNRPVRIYHLPCFKIGNWMWWGSAFCNFGLGGQTCWKCKTEITPEQEEFLLKAWELYVF